MYKFEATNINGESLSVCIKHKCFENNRDFGLHGLHNITRKILSERGISSQEDIRKFIWPKLSDLYNPFLLKDMDLAVDRIIRSHQKKEHVLIVGDYDVDGITSTSLLMHFFKQIGLECEFRIPTREDGYGFNLNIIKDAYENGIHLIITVDNGITSIDEVEFAKQMGIDVIITDHHEPDREIPKAYAVVDPKRRDSSFPFGSLSGVGVAFKFIMALRNRLRSRGFFNNITEPNLKQYLDIVALGTMADIVPLLSENRIFVKYGLSIDGKLNKVYNALKRIINLNGTLDEYKVGFILAPRINAAGRLYNASIAMDMFMEEDEDELYEIVKQLDDINRERQKIQTGIVKEIEKLVTGNNNPILVISNKDWHRGVIGIVANVISNKFLKPTIVIREEKNVSIGSGRSIENIDLLSLIRNASDLLERFGGHKMAVGISIRNDFIGDFAIRMNEEMEKKYGSYNFQKVIDVDCETYLSLFTYEFLKELSLFRPYGEGNVEPLFLIRHAVIRDVKMFLNKFKKILIDDGTSAQWIIVFDRDFNANQDEKYDFILTARLHNGFVSFAAKEILKSDPLCEVIK